MSGASVFWGNLHATLKQTMALQHLTRYAAPPNAEQQTAEAENYNHRG